MNKAHLISILQSAGLISQSNADLTMELHEQSGEPVGKILVSKQMVSESQLYRFICNDLHMNPDTPFNSRSYGIAGKTIPRLKISGDFYGYFPLDESRVAITLSDVSGKGLEAGIIAILLANMLLTAIKMKNTIPSSIVRKINVTSADYFDIDQFATFILLILDMDTNTVEFCCAGSPPILVYRRKENIVEELKVKGIPIGIYKDFLFNGGRENLNRGDVLLLYTDGAYEAQNASGEYYGIERLKQRLAHHASKPAPKIIDGLKRDLRWHTKLRSLNDDTTYIAIKKNLLEGHSI